MSPDRSSAWSSLNLGFSLKRVRECFPLSSLQAATLGLALTPPLVYSLGEKTRSPLIQREKEGGGQRREGILIDFHIGKYLPPFPHFSLLRYSLPPPPAPRQHTASHSWKSLNLYRLFFFSFLKDGVQSFFFFFLMAICSFPTSNSPFLSRFFHLFFRPFSIQCSRFKGD